MAPYTTIYQVLGRFTYSRVEFNIGGDKYEASLSADALRQHLRVNGDKNVQITIFTPESLVELIEDLPDEILFGSRVIQEMIVKEILSHHIISDAVVKVIPAKGRYNQYEYNTSIETIITMMFLHILEDNPDEIYIDISTGHNIYPIALLEAARRYLTYKKLENLLQNADNINTQRKISGIHVLFVPQIFKGTTEVKVEFYDLDVKAFFALPRCEFNRICGSRTHDIIDDDYKRLSRRINLIRSNLIMSFNALKRNIPLAFYYLPLFKIHLDEEEIEVNLPLVSTIEKDLLRFIMKKSKPINAGGVIERLPFSSIQVSNIFFSFALYKSLIKFASKLERPTVDEIEEYFNAIYRKENIGLASNVDFLSNELQRIRDKVKTSNSSEFVEFQLLSNLFSTGGSSSLKRNFFAHCGFIYDFTMVKRESDGSIIICWKNRHLAEIIAWLR
ncbi:MAG: TM1812 family CRISPR-associated protein [Promethearchaeota archaeon]